MNFDSGGWLSRFTSRTAIDADLAAFIVAFLGHGSNRYLVAQDFNSIPGDPWLQTSKIPYFTVHEEVYLFLDGYHADTGRVISVLHDCNTANSILNIAMLTELVEGHQIESTEELSSITLQALAASTQHIIVEAFDGEGMLLWSNG